MLLSRLTRPFVINRPLLSSTPLFINRYTTMVATETQQPIEQLTPEQEQIRHAEIERDALDIVVKNRADPEIVEYVAYSHSSKSEKEHSLTVTVSPFVCKKKKKKKN
jgi:hypothetical protein